MAGSDGMAGWTTFSAEEGGRTGLGEGERDDGADLAGRFGMDRLGLRAEGLEGFGTDRVLRTRDEGRERERERERERRTKKNLSLIHI